MKGDARSCLIRFLLTCTSQQYLYILKTLTKDQLQIIAEILHNVLHGVCPISDKNKTILMKQKRSIREVISPRLTLVQRRQRLIKIRKLLPIFLEACLQYGT